jgi:hypothetical protein
MLILVKFAFLAKDVSKNLFHDSEKDIPLSTEYVYCEFQVQAQT